MAAEELLPGENEELEPKGAAQGGARCPQGAKGCRGLYLPRRRDQTTCGNNACRQARHAARRELAGFDLSLADL